jgi:phosphoglycerol transferase MdoB-like AlkP superfamily enzyme
MNWLKRTFDSPFIIVILFATKLMIYYSLIDVDLKHISLIILSIIAMGIIFVIFSRSNLKYKKGLFLIVYSLLSLLMFSDSMYYNYYNQTVSIKQLWQAANVASVPKSFIATLIPVSFLLFLDIPLVYYHFKKLNKENSIQETWSLKKEIKYIVTGVITIFILLSVNPLSSVAIEKVNSVEFFTNHINDIYISIKDNIKNDKIPEEEILEAVEEVAAKNQGKQLYGIGKDKNLIVIQLESFQNFVIGAEYNGQVLTPNLNALIEKDSLYFDRYYSIIGKGNTVDAEFATLNSLYPVIDREAYTLYSNNTFNGLPWLLREQGYHSFAIHGFKGEFWNREVAYPGQGFEEFYSMEDLDATDLIGLGISDKTLFKQAIEIIGEEENAFFSFIVSLTSHHPYILEEKDTKLKLKVEDENTKFGSYLKTIHYADEAIGQLIKDLKEDGLYENTIIALYGDHHGLNVNMDGNAEIMSQFLGKAYDYDEMLRVPLVIHIPNADVKQTVSTTGGFTDFLPTIANIMGFEIGQPYILGQDLINATDGFTAFTAYLFEGSFIHNNIMFQISREGVFDGSRAWDINTNLPVNASEYEEDYNKAIKLKKTSLEILEQNLIDEYVDR